MDLDSVLLISCVLGVVIMNLLISKSKKSRNELRSRREKIRNRYTDIDDGDVA